ncbi:MAG: ATP-binding protein [Flavobacteriales bacterium]|nr:ATP-binding protein [Flavobacteriales bacterium]
MKTKRIVITGGPGSGKTTLISHLDKLGHTCLHEISREVILAAQKEGIDQLFLQEPVLFSEKLMEGRLAQFFKADEHAKDHVFYDRGLPDITAYMDYSAVSYPDSFSDTCKQFTYDHVFLLPPWESIYTSDNERYESFEQATLIFDFLRKAYRAYGYDVCEVPIGTIEDRANYILEKLKHTD